jgi:ribonucleotide reductase alpha subunit
MVVNKHLYKDLSNIGMWTTEVIRNIIANKGSMQNVLAPEDLTKKKRFEYLKVKYLTAFEIPQKCLMQLSIERGKYICQTQSFNCFMTKPTKGKLNAYHFYGWKNGIKTGMYYLRQKAGSMPVNNSITSIVVPKNKTPEVVCNDEVCIVCQT